jgi:hypothetical protein
MQARQFQLLAGWMLAVSGALCASGAMAADAAAAAPGHVTDTWIFWPKDGQGLKFEAAVKEHAACARAQAKASPGRFMSP